GQRGTLMFPKYSAFALSLLTLCTTTALAQHTPDLVTTYCAKCHNFEDWAGSLDLESLDFDHVASAPQDWETVIRKLSAGMMPPVGEPRPSNDEVDAFIANLEGRLDEQVQVIPASPA